MKTYAICGLSSRAIGNFVLPLIGNPKLPEYGDYREHGKIVAVLDLDQERVEAFNRNQGTNFAFYPMDAFDRMIKETNPDVIIVTTPDGLHAPYIIKALEHNKEVITEKPMVIDGKQAQAVIEAERKSKARVRVAHNYRYTPLHKAIKQIILDGKLGRVVHAQMIYLLDTFHGSSYFARWNRDRSMSGGLSITKGCHHFDLLNWWLDDMPEEVFAYGARNYYGANSPHDPAILDGKEYSIQEKKVRNAYHRRWNIEGINPPKDDHIGAHEAAFVLPMKKQYPQPLGIFDKEIDIEDTYSATIRYRSGINAMYSLNASSPWEGYVLGIQGTHGRLETIHYTAPDRCPFPAPKSETITYYPLFGEREVHDIRHVAGGHGGADDVLKYEMFVRPSEEGVKLRLPAGSLDGALAIAVGEGVWRSARENRPIKIADLLGSALE